MRDRLAPVPILLTLALAATPARAELTEVADGHFTVRHAAPLAATAREAFRVMTVEINQWWHPDHTWTGDAANLYFQPGIPGHLGEHLPGGGGVEHLRTVFWQPPQMVRMIGGLGPLQGMGVTGTMTWQITEHEGQRELVFEYIVHGSVDGGLQEIAPAVDGVIGQQHQRLMGRLGGD